VLPRRSQIASRRWPRIDVAKPTVELKAKTDQRRLEARDPSTTRPEPQNPGTSTDWEPLARFVKYRGEYYDIELYRAVYSDLRQFDDHELVQHYIHCGSREGRHIRYIHPPLDPSCSNLNYSIVGYFNGAFGLAENARQLYSALDSTNVVVRAVDSQVPWHSFNRNYEADYVGVSESEGPINIFCINWNEGLSYMSGKFYDMTVNKVNAVLWAFEVDRVLPLVSIYEKYFPKIFTISQHCRKALINSGIEDARVITLHIPSIDYTQAYPTRLQSIEHFKTSQSIKPLKLKLDKHLFYVGFVFDFCSSLDRKNVLDTIQVFSDSIASRSDCYLIVKHINHKLKRKDYLRLRRKIDQCQYKSKIIEIKGALSNEEMRYLYSLFNVYISLHRAEGSGLTLMDCIYRGIPTICTGYSGNLDFCTAFNSFLVDYTYVKIPEEADGYGDYSSLCQWAQPNLETAKSHLLDIYQNYDKCCESVQEHKYYIRNKYNPQFLGKQIVGGTASLRKQDYSKRKILFVIHFSSRVEILDEYLQKIYAVSGLRFHIMIGINRPGLKEELLRNHYFQQMRQHIEVVEYENYGMNSSGYLHMFSQCSDICSYDLVHCLHTKSVKKWRDGIVGSLLSQQSIEAMLSYIDVNPGTGLISAKNTILPLFNDRETVEALCKLYKIDTSFYDVYHDEHPMFYRQDMDAETYLNNYIDIRTTCNGGAEALDHWRRHGIHEKRICDRSLNERLMYNPEFPLFNAGNIQVLNPKVVEFWRPYIVETLRLCEPEVNKPCDTGKSTYTHALERMPGIISHHLKLDLCEMDHLNVVIKRQYI
jgi:hypothetical protein